VRRLSCHGRWSAGRCCAKLSGNCSSTEYYRREFERPNYDAQAPDAGNSSRISGARRRRCIHQIATMKIESGRSRGADEPTGPALTKNRQGVEDGPGDENAFADA
jgi:hypothetical protein